MILQEPQDVFIKPVGLRVILHSLHGTFHEVRRAATLRGLLSGIGASSLVHLALEAICMNTNRTIKIT